MLDRYVSVGLALPSVQPWASQFPIKRLQVIIYKVKALNRGGQE